MEFFTIGVYNSGEESFFGKIQAANIDTFCDIRQRRGVRGANYAFVNSRRLQERLSLLGIRYLHHKDLAPTREIRDLQRAADKKEESTKRHRHALGGTFCDAYNSLVIQSFDFGEFLRNLTAMGSQRIVLFCVEEKPAACHRSLVANELEQCYGFKTQDL